ncbi:transposase [Moorena sp. SIOASIH]|uniref:transposase n=1 Tax=Moorena sp. SIOASIH TaxID=2607817 RepID=UPI0025F3FC63|nr:transposase [Moorena sp. SIOASIH]
MITQIPKGYQEWFRVVMRKMPHLSKSQAVGLAMGRFFGIAITQSCGLSTVAVFLAEIQHRSENNVREQLRQWYKEKSHKYGRKRQEIEVSESFAFLLLWILSWWSSDQKSLVLAADASTLGKRFTVLVISVVYRGCGIPVAWKIVGATEKGSWQPYWHQLLNQVKQGIPDDWFVIVTTDRGLYAKWFYQGIVANGWHPLMRINAQGYYQPSQVLGDQPPSKLPLSGLITEVGQHWSGRVRCFRSNCVDCTLLARWDHGYADPWLMLTDLSPQQAQIYWYSMRSWIECLFKDIKRGGFGWHHTKMTDPKRAERQW